MCEYQSLWLLSQEQEQDGQWWLPQLNAWQTPHESLEKMSNWLHEQALISEQAQESSQCCDSINREHFLIGEDSSQVFPIPGPCQQQLAFFLIFPFSAFLSVHAFFGSCRGISWSPFAQLFSLLSLTHSAPRLTFWCFFMAGIGFSS